MAIKAFSAVLGKPAYEQWLYLPDKWFLGKPLFKRMRKKKTCCLLQWLPADLPQVRVSCAFPLQLSFSRGEDGVILNTVRGLGCYYPAEVFFLWWIFKEVPAWAQCSLEVFFNTILFNSDEKREKIRQEKQIAAHSPFIKKLTMKSWNTFRL